MNRTKLGQTCTKTGLKLVQEHRAPCLKLVGLREHCAVRAGSVR
jgi:hypothetical protein